ncbi:uncharacterized protein LOC125114987 [Phacochoerus africanus]|uniref:uncharacterized protein LOC125114987 n=1 Tax=Phacochoerus africanus TaxID=41426 RepID=UPI001FD8BCE1|nr:uncharacterized protein LOC125114987 [Phacochoerus africanus]
MTCGGANEDSQHLQTATERLRARRRGYRHELRLAATNDQKTEQNSRPPTPGSLLSLVAATKLPRLQIRADGAVVWTTFPISPFAAPRELRRDRGEDLRSGATPPSFREPPRGWSHGGLSGVRERPANSCLWRRPCCGICGNGETQTCRLNLKSDEWSLEIKDVGSRLEKRPMKTVIRKRYSLSLSLRPKRKLRKKTLAAMPRWLPWTQGRISLVSAV